MNHLSEELLVQFRYGDAEDFVAIEKHLAECAQCHAEYETIQRVLAAVDAAPIPERDELYGARVWWDIEPRLPERRSFGWRAWLAPRRWVPAVAVALLVVMAFVIGRFWPRPQPELSNASISQPVRERILLVAVGDHLDRSQMLLLEMVNAGPEKDGTAPVDISSEQARAQDLVSANRLYRQTALRSGNSRDRAVASLLDELEPVLLEIAHSPSEMTPQQFESIRKRIEDRGLLFRVRVVGSDVREREKEAVPAATPSPARKNS
jgi:hypothetical protein